MSTLLFVTSACFGVVAYIYYFNDTKRSGISPNRWSWLAFTVSVLMESLTYNELSEDWVKTTLFFISASCCIVVTVLIWSMSEWGKPNWTETVCLTAAVVAAVLWLWFERAGWAHLVTLVAIPVSFWPTYQGAYHNWRSENTPAWMLWTMGDLLATAMVLLRLESLEELPYAVAEFLAHAAVWLIVSRKRRASSV